MTLDGLSDAWNGLRNAALGQGVQPLVSAPLAEKIGNWYERFRTWANDPAVVQIGPVDLSASMFSDIDWIAKYRELFAAVQAEGVKVPEPLPASLPENVVAVARSASNAIVIMLLAAAPLAYFILRGTRGRR